MTDKQIIIDGIDISKCKHYDEVFNYCDQSYLGEGGLLKNTKNPKRCECSPNCYYKQLKRKEQECEELKEEIDDLKEIIQRHDNDNNVLLSEFEDDLVDYYRRHKECLLEIKEIAENMNNECFYDDFECKDCDMKNGCTYFNKKQILQKISEVLDDRQK